jgi:hypothetical protein
MNKLMIEKPIEIENNSKEINEQIRKETIRLCEEALK